MKRSYQYLLVFIFGTVLRVIPELFSVYPAGCDIPEYAIELELFMTRLDWDILYFGSPLAFFIASFFKVISGLDYLTIWKVITPILNGMVGVAFFFFLDTGLKWSFKKSFVAVSLLLLSETGMIMSNGIIKHQLAIVFTFFFMSYYIRQDLRKMLVFAPLVALSHIMPSLLLVGMLSLDLFYGLVKKHLKIDCFLVLITMCSVIFLLMFVLPALGSPDPLAEMLTYIKIFMGSEGYSNAAVSAKLKTIDWAVHHFRYYFSLLLPLALFGLFKNKTMILWSIVLAPLAFIPLGTSYMRWQWLYAYPCAIFGAHTLVTRLRFPRAQTLDRLFLGVKGALFVFLIVTAIQYETNILKNASSNVRFDEIPAMLGAYEYLSPQLTNNSLIFSSVRAHSWYKAEMLHDGLSANNMITENTIFLIKNSSGFWACKTNIRGYDFYVFREPTMWFDLHSYDNVFIMKDNYFVSKDTFGEYWQYFEKVYECDGNVIYKLESKKQTP